MVVDRDHSRQMGNGPIGSIPRCHSRRTRSTATLQGLIDADAGSSSKSLAGTYSGHDADAAVIARCTTARE